MNNTPVANRCHIAFFGRTNAGKSSLINAITNQEIATVSKIAGTTTDPVYKSMEILPLGAVMLIDTAGFMDDSELGKLREKASKKIIDKTEIALVIVDASSSDISFEKNFANELKSKKIRTLIVINKIDLSSEDKEMYEKAFDGFDLAFVSSKNHIGIEGLKEKIASMIPDKKSEIPIISDLIEPSDIVVLVTPIDASAPKGRLILPQQQTIRDILDSGAISVVCKETELENSLKALAKKPALVVTDSQAFDYVAKRLPRDIALTSFSILFARHKGDLEELVRGAKALKGLKNGDKILISEACTHHRQCEDIGSVKIPNWLRKHTGMDFDFDFSSGGTFTEVADDYKVIIHCGGCMINKKAMQSRIETAKKANVPIVNYGVLIAYLHGILDRALEIFEDANLIWREK